MRLSSRSPPFTHHSEPFFLGLVKSDYLELDSAFQFGQKAHEPIEREPFDAPTPQIRESRWVDLEQLCRDEEVHPAGDPGDLTRKLLFERGDGILEHTTRCGAMTP
jgi:hypothetical protein